MDETIIKKLEEQQQKIDKIYVSVEKTRRYILITAIVTIAAIVLPLIGLAFAIPQYLHSLTSLSQF